jgi:Beta-propeller repeat
MKKKSISRPVRQPAREDSLLAKTFGVRSSLREREFLNLHVLLGVLFFVGVSLALFAVANPALTREGASRPQTQVHRPSRDTFSRSGIVQEAWAARYNGSGNGDDATTAVAVDKQGNVYVTGFSLSTVLPDYDYVTIKYNSTGEEQWVRTYGGTGNDTAMAIAVDDAGNVYVTGGVLDPDTDYDYVTIKYDSSGQEQWVATYNGPRKWQ